MMDSKSKNKTTQTIEKANELTKKEQEQRSERLNVLFKKTKKLITTQEHLTTFNEPVVLLIRRYNRVEFIELNGSTKLTFKHTDGEELELNLPATQLLTFDYAGKTFTGFIHYEDEAYPYPRRPLFYSEAWYATIQKIKADIKNRYAEKINAWGDLLLKVGIGAGLVIGAYFLFRGSGQQPITPQQVAEAVVNLSNTTMTTLGQMGIG